MHRIEDFPIFIKKGSEMHWVFVLGPGVFGGYYIANNRNGLPEFVHKFGSDRIATICARQQFEGITKRKTEKFQFIK
jgi:hypothetical protein